MKKYIYGLSAVAIISGSVIPNVYADTTPSAEKSSVSVSPDGETFVLAEPPGLIEQTDIAELVLEKYFGGEQGQIIRYYEYNDEATMKSDIEYRIGYYEEFEIPQSVVKKADKLPEEDQLTAVKTMLADYYNEAENWSGLVSLLGINTPNQGFKDIWVDKELKEQFLEGQKAAINELKTNTKKDLSQEDYEMIWDNVTIEEKVSNRLRTKEIILEKAEERYDSVLKDGRGQEKEVFIPLMIFSFISVLVGFTLFARR